jgi:tetratricopeptide (TPR) repeat protein
LRVRCIALSLLSVLAAYGCSPQRTRSAAELSDAAAMIDLEGLEPSVRTQFEAAIAAVRTSPESVATVSDLAMTLHAYGRPAAAVEFYRQARKLEPNVARWVYLQGVAEAESGDSAGAVASLTECLALSPQLVAARIRLADLLVLVGRPEESRPIYASVLEAGPSAAARFGLGKVAAAEGRLDEAVRHFEAALEWRPGFREAHYALGQAYRRLGEQAKSTVALARFEDSEANLLPFDDPWMDDVAEIRQGSFEHHFRLARGHEQAGRFNEALREYLRAAELAPDAARVHVNLVGVYGRLRNVARATEHYERARQLDPEIEELHYNYGVLMAGAASFDAAVAAFRSALEINPRSAEAHNNLGYALEQTGRIGEAVAEYETAVAAKPDYALPRIHLARLHLSNGRYAKAVPHLEEALRFEKDQAAYLGFLLARAYAETGDLAAAGKQAQAARRLALAQGSHELVRKIDRHFPAAP